MKTKRFLALFLMLAMLIGMMPMTVFAYSEDYFYDEEPSIDVSTDGKVYSIYTEDYLDEKNGMTFLYVVKRGDRYYTLSNPRYTEFKEVDSVNAVDITEYYDAQTNTFSGISNNVNVGVMQYQMNSGSYMYVDGDMLFAFISRSRLRLQSGMGLILNTMIFICPTSMMTTRAWMR